MTQTASEREAKANRIEDLRRQIYGVAGSLYKFAKPAEDGKTNWDHVEPLNVLLYELIAQGEDVKAFVVPYGWKEDYLVETFVKDRLLVQRLDGLLVYLKSVGLPAPS